MKKLALAASLATLAGIGLAYAADIPAAAQGKDRTVARADALARADRMFDRMDINNDGKLDAADREARHAVMFDRMDTNKDGSISRAEFMAMHSQGGMNRHGMGHGGMNHEGMNHQAMMGHGKRGHGMMGHMMLRMADADRDGAVTKAELTAAAASRFDRMDSNRDGQLTSAERQAARAAMREEMQHRHAAGAPAGTAN